MKIYVATPCKVEFCLFNKQSTCTLIERPSIGESGMCEQCIMLVLDDNSRELAKAQQLRMLEDSGLFPLPDRFC